MVAPSHHNGSPGSPAHTGEGGESRDDGDQRKADTHAGEGKRPYLRDMTDVHPVNHVIQDIDDLGGDGRQCQLEKKLSDAVVAQVCGFFCTHKISSPF